MRHTKFAWNLKVKRSGEEVETWNYKLRGHPDMKKYTKIISNLTVSNEAFNIITKQNYSSKHLTYLSKYRMTRNNQFTMYTDFIVFLLVATLLFGNWNDKTFCLVACLSLYTVDTFLCIHMSPRCQTRYIWNLIF